MQDVRNHTRDRYVKACRLGSNSGVAGNWHNVVGHTCGKAMRACCLLRRTIPLHSTRIRCTTCGRVDPIPRWVLVNAAKMSQKAMDFFEVRFPAGMRVMDVPTQRFMHWVHKRRP